MHRIIRIVIIGIVALTFLTGLAPGILAQGTPAGGQVFSTVPQAVEQQIDPSIDPQTVQVIVIAPNGARADDDRPVRRLQVYERFHLQGVGQGAQHEDAVEVLAPQGWDDGRRSCPYDQRVVGYGGLAHPFQVSDA